MKKTLSVILIVALVLSTVTAAIAATSNKVELSSRTVSNQAIGYDAKNKGYFEYLIFASDLPKVKYTEVTPKITVWDGIFIVSNSDVVIGRLWPDYEEGKAKPGKGIVDFGVAFNKSGELLYSKMVTCYTTDGIDTTKSTRHLRFVDVEMEDGSTQTHLVVVKDGKNTDPKPTQKPTATPTQKPQPTQKPTDKPTEKPQPTQVPVTPTPMATPRVTPKPELNDPENTATTCPTPTPKPQLNDPENTATAAPNRPTPRPVVTDPNPTLRPDQLEKLDFEDIPAEKPTGKPTPRPVITDTNPTLRPGQESKLDFVDIPTTNKPKVTPAPQVETVAEPTKKPTPKPAVNNTDQNPELDSGSGLDF